MVLFRDFFIFTPMASIFTKIINREIPGHIIAEDDRFIAFLDIQPLVKGHVLVVPKEETDYIFDLEDDVLAGLHVFSKKIAEAIDKTIKCSRVGVAVIGLDVPHVHIHLIPLHTIDDINFSKPKLKLNEGELQAIANLIRSGLD
jgi:histidine triad (HIT) family protein